MSADAKEQPPLDLVCRLLASLPLPAFVVDEQHSVHYLNRAARQRSPEPDESKSPCYSRIFHRDAPCDLCVMTEATVDGADEVLCSQEIAGQQVRATGIRFVEGGTAYVAEIVHMGGEGLVSSRSSTDLREDAMHSVIDSSSEVVLLFDRDYRPVIVNRLAQQTLGYTAAEFAELTFVDLGIAKSTEELGQLLARADSGAPATARAVILSRQGGKMPVKVSLSLLVGSSTRVVGACTFAAPRYSSAGMPALQRTASGPVPKPGLERSSGPVPKPSLERASGPVPKPGLSAPPATPTKPKPPARPAPPGGAPGTRAPDAGSTASAGKKSTPPAKPAGLSSAPAAKSADAGGVRRISESLESLAGDLETESTVIRKGAKEKRSKLPKAPPPPTPDSVAGGQELDPELLEVEELEERAAASPPPPPKTPPKPPKSQKATAPSPPKAPPTPQKDKAKASPSKAPPTPQKDKAKASPSKAPPTPQKDKAKASPPKAPPKTPPKPQKDKIPAAPPPVPPPSGPAPVAAVQPPKEVTVHVVADPSVVASASESIEGLLGYSSSEVVTWTAKDWFTRLHETQLAEDLENMWSGLVGQVFEPGALPDQTMEYPLIRKDGTIVECSTTWRAVQAADGKFEGLEVVIRPKLV